MIVRLALIGCLSFVACGNEAVGEPPAPRTDAASSQKLDTRASSYVSDAGGAADTAVTADVNSSVGSDALAAGGDTRPNAPDATAATDLPPAAPAGQYTCNHVFGGVMVGEWFDAFEKIVDTQKWQYVAVRAATPDSWANPAHTAWTKPVTSPCAQGSKTPDRVVFYAASFLTDSKLANDAGWEKVFSDVVANIQKTFPGVKRIDLLTVHAGPKNAVCGGDAKTSIPSGESAAIAAVAAKNPGLVVAGPAFQFASCGLFRGHHYNAQGNTQAAQDISAHLGR
jgi:hypothetical protein